MTTALEFQLHLVAGCDFPNSSEVGAKRWRSAGFLIENWSSHFISQLWLQGFELQVDGCRCSVPFCVASLRAFVGFNSATEKSLMYQNHPVSTSKIFLCLCVFFIAICGLCWYNLYNQIQSFLLNRLKSLKNWGLWIGWCLCWRVPHYKPLSMLSAGVKRQWPWLVGMSWCGALHKAWECLRLNRVLRFWWGMLRYSSNMFHQAENSPKKFGLDLGFHNDLPIRLHLGNLGNEASIASEALNGSQANRSWNEVLTEAPSAFTAPLLEVTLGLFQMKVQIGMSCDQWVEYDSSLVENPFHGPRTSDKACSSSSFGCTRGL